MPKRTDPRLPPRFPYATYRVQLNANFGFADAAAIVSYLHQLGISDLYASPYLQARPGSDHGYDITDHGRLNSRLGGEDAYALLATELRAHGMGQLLDVVPNHMGIAEPENRWWMDVLENGRLSPFAPWFDIDWDSPRPELRGKVLLPILGNQFGRVLENGELRLHFEDGRFRIRFEDHVLPVSPRSSSLVLRLILAEMGTESRVSDEDLAELESIVTALEHLPTRDTADDESIAGIRRESLVSRRRLLSLHRDSAAFRAALERIVRLVNGHRGEPRSFDALEQLLDAQSYRLAYWRVAAEEINYRRFFDVNHLAGIRVEKGEVFEATHDLVFRLIRDGEVTGLRIDHIDGLLAPRAYLEDVQAHASRHAGEGPVYVAVEKILTGSETLRPDWPVAGTVGYEFLNLLNGLFVVPTAESAMTEIYQEFVDTAVDYGDLVHDRKKLILRLAMGSELAVLSRQLDRISEQNRRFRDFTLGSFTHALRETIACFPVYRSYVDPSAGEVEAADAEAIDVAIRSAMRRNRAMNPTVFEFIRDILLLRWPDDLDRAAREQHARFVLRFQQLTGSVMAKGVEDTTFYIYNRLLSLNEVGGAPDRFGVTPDELHRSFAARAKSWPLAMNAASTHDTKRSEDVRARINVLSEIPESWRTRVMRWAEMNRPLRNLVDDDPVPDANDEYFLYQTLVGTLPLDGLAGPDAIADYRDRILDCMEKATREAKRHTSWVNPNAAYDSALREFVTNLLGGPNAVAGAFLHDLGKFVEEIAWFGMINSLAQTLVRFTAPGIPDLYQGREVWDFSLVDPDNRRPVEFTYLAETLETIRGRLATDSRADLAAELLARWRDGAIKLYVTHLALAIRRRHPELLTRGGYLPLTVEGSAADHIFAFARTVAPVAPSTASRLPHLVVAVPRHSAVLQQRTGSSIVDPGAWGDTLLRLPASISGVRYRDAFTGREFSGETLQAGDLFEGFPLAALENSEG